MKFSIFLKILIPLVVLFGLYFLLSHYFFKNNTPEKQPALKEAPKEVTKEAPKDVEVDLSAAKGAENFKACFGEVQKIEGSVILLKIDQSKNVFKEDLVLDIAIDSSTKFLKIANNLSSVRADAAGKILFNFDPRLTSSGKEDNSNLDINSLEVGDKLIVITSGNILDVSNIKTVAVYLIKR